MTKKSTSRCIPVRFAGAVGLGTLVLLVVSASSRVCLAQPSQADAARFLEQATFGPTPDLVAHVQDVGLAGYLNEQFGMDLPTDYLGMETCPTSDGRCPQDPPNGCGGGTACNRLNYSMHDLQQRFFKRALNTDILSDQLRQRVAFALNQIMVISAFDGNLNRLNRMQPYLQVLDKNAFGNFRNLLYDITLNAGMGRYLDMVNNKACPPPPQDCKNPPNENYAREILQLFSIGLDELNPDGTPILKPDEQGNLVRVPTYSQETITNFAAVFTGWTFQVQPDPPLSGYTNYIDPMRVGNENNHDRTPKTLLDHGDASCSPPGGENALPELNEALDCIWTSPYVGPYIGMNLIQHLVTSNPSPAYVSHVTDAFNNGTFTDPDSGQTFGTTGRGDLEAVIAAILLDPEARGDVAPNADYGHLREPVLWITNLLRAFNTGDSTTDYVLSEQYLPSDIRMDENLFRSPTVFNFFPPNYVIPGETLLGPEFAILSTATALARINFACDVVYHGAAPYNSCNMGTNGDRPKGTWIDPNALLLLPNAPQDLVDSLNNRMMHGTMSDDMNSRIVSAVSGIADPLARAREAVYLVATSSQYSVER